MDLAIRTLPLAPSQSHHHILHVQRISTAGSLGFSSSQHCLLVCKKLPHLQRVHTRLRIPHCNADGAGSEAAGEADRAPGIEEKPAASPQPQETPPEEPLSTLAQVSPSTKASDPYAGWDSADDYVKDSKSGNSSWMKIGTITILSIGLALGAGFLYTRKEASREFSVPPPVKEQVVPSVASSDSLQASENLDESSGIPKLQQNDQKEFVKQDRDVSFEPESKTAGQISILSEDLEDDHKMEDFHHVSVSSTASASTLQENIEHNECSPGISTSVSIVPPVEDVAKEESSANILFESNQGETKLDVESSDKVSSLSTVSEEVVGDDTSPQKSSVALPDASVTVSSSLSALHTSALGESNLSGSEKFLNDEVDDVHAIYDATKSSSDINVESASCSKSVHEEVTLVNVPYMPESSIFDAEPTLHDIPFKTQEFMTPSNETNSEKESNQRELWVKRKSDVEPFDSTLESRWWLSAGLTAPSASSAAWLKPLGRVVVPASVDHMQEQVLAALQALKVIETGVQAGDICTRREYARWLISTSGILSRSPAHKVFPAMYIEDGTKLAYDDVLPEDPDFPFIQGLAEAGLISSRLLANDGQSKETLIQESQSCKFYPDSPLTRQDLVSWKVAFEREHHLPPGVTPPVEKEVLQKVSGFVDIDMVDHDAWPALLADLSSGEKSIISLAFGYTRRFQPEKPVTKAQAAVALATGEAWELVSEELARLEAESIAEAAVAAELALESRAQQEVVAAFNELLKLEQEKQEAATSLVEKTRAELEKVKADWEEEKVMLLKERAALDSEKEFFSKLRHEVEEHALTLSNTKFEVALEKEQAERLRAAAEEERESIRKVRSELEIEKNALSLARIWAEEEARKAHAHAKLLEQARKRWENEGVQVHVDKELDESNIPGPTWRYSKDVRVQKSYIEMLKEKGQNIGKVIMDTWIWVLHFVHLVFCAIRQKASELLGKLDENYHVSRDRCSNLASKAVETFQQTVPTALGGVASGVREGTSKVVSEMREGAERLAQKLKIA